MPRRCEQGAVDGALELARPLHRDLHHRLEDPRPRPAVGLAEGRPGRDLEGHVRGVDGVGVAVVEHHPHPDDREADQAALGERAAETLVAGRDELGRDGAAADLVDELVVPPLARLDVAGHPGVLARAAGLLAVQVVEVGPLRDRLAVGDLRGAGLDHGAVLAAHPLDVDVEVQLAHAGDDGLAALLVEVDPEGRVFLGRSGGAPCSC